MSIALLHDRTERPGPGGNRVTVTDPPRSRTSARLGAMRPPQTGDVNATLEAYLDELDRWSARLNLTSIPRAQMWSRNVVEAEELLEVAAPPPGCRVVDVGSGGGVPGMVIAILRPDLAVTLLDSDRRKCGFLVHVAGLLGLAGVVVEALRAEDAGRRDGLREAFDLATSRATAPPPVLCERHRSLIPRDLAGRGLDGLLVALAGAEHRVPGRRLRHRKTDRLLAIGDDEQ